MIFVQVMFSRFKVVWHLSVHCNYRLFPRYGTILSSSRFIIEDKYRSSDYLIPAALDTMQVYLPHELQLMEAQWFLFYLDGINVDRKTKFISKMLVLTRDSQEHLSSHHEQTSFFKIDLFGLPFRKSIFTNVATNGNAFQSDVTTKCVLQTLQTIFVQL